jgi:hypothetical protein
MQKKEPDNAHVPQKWVPVLRPEYARKHGPKHAINIGKPAFSADCADYVVPNPLKRLSIPQFRDTGHDPEEWAPVFRKDHAQTKGSRPKTLTVRASRPIRPRFLEMDEILDPR